VVVTDAALADGLLSIDLRRELPEAMKPRRIDIKGAGQSGPELIEGQAQAAA
jgi:molecular chaperone IbpA